MSANETGFGIILSMNELQDKLRTISSGSRRWTAELVFIECDEKGPTTVCAEIWYNNPVSPDMPNEICWRFPVLRQLSCGEMESFVCLHASLAVPVQGGLYFDGDRLLCDPLEDFYSFWPPIREALS
jgi:hypothetical protein